MKLLLDTCTFLWITGDDPQLSGNARQLFISPNNEVYLSAVSVWEMLVKYQLGRLPLPEPAYQFIPHQRIQHRIDSLSLDEKATLEIAHLPHHHKDPFDRMPICQAIVHGMPLVTPDADISRYPVRTTW